MQRLPGIDEFLLVIKSLPALESSQELLSDLFEVPDDVSYVFAWHQICFACNFSAAVFSTVCAQGSHELFTMLVHGMGFNFQPGELCSPTVASNIDQSANCLNIIERRRAQLLKQPVFDLASRLRVFRRRLLLCVLAHAAYFSVVLSMNAWATRVTRAFLRSAISCWL